jgi:hypothetical protein
MRSSLTLAILVAFALLAACGERPAEKPVMDELAKQQLMDEFQNRKVYRSLDPSILAAIPDDDVELAIVDYVHARIGSDYEAEARILSAMPVGIRALYVTWGVEAEVNNGGFNQYYWNSTGRFASEAVAAFEFFSAPKHAQLMQEANLARAGEKAEIDKFKGKGTLEAFSESYKASRLGSLDERFYKLDENLSALRVAKIRAAPALFSAD